MLNEKEVGVWLVTRHFCTTAKRYNRSANEARQETAQTIIAKINELQGQKRFWYDKIRCIIRDETEAQLYELLGALSKEDRFTARYKLGFCIELQNVFNIDTSEELDVLIELAEGVM